MKRELWIGVLLSAACLALTGQVLGANPADSDQKMDSERISLSIKDASVKQLLTLYRDLLDVEVDYQCSEDKRISLSFEEIKIRTSLNAISESAGLEWILVPGNPAVLRFTCAHEATRGEAKRSVIRMEDQGGPTKAGDVDAKAEVRVRKTARGHGQKDVSVSINLKGADLADSMKMAARLLEAKLVMDASLEGGKVTVKMDQVPLRDFLDAVCKQAGATWRLEPGDPPTLEVGKGS